MTNCRIDSPNARPHPGSQVEMETFDHLPADLRAALRESVFDISSQGAARAVLSMGPVVAIDTLRASLVRDLPRMIVGAYGPDHPQARQLSR